MILGRKEKSQEIVGNDLNFMSFWLEKTGFIFFIVIIFVCVLFIVNLKVMAVLCNSNITDAHLIVLCSYWTAD